MLRTNADNSLQWARRFGQPRQYDPQYIHDEAYGVRQLPNGNFLIIGGSGDEYSQYSSNTNASGPSDEWKAYVVIIDGNGVAQSEKVYGDGAGNGNNAAEYVALSSAGGYVLFIDSDSRGNPQPSNFGFMKIAE